MRRHATLAVILTVSTLSLACAKRAPGPSSLGTQAGASDHAGVAERRDAPAGSGPSWAAEAPPAEPGTWSDGRASKAGEGRGSAGPAADEAWKAQPSPVEESRPGLGTAYGETRSSSVETVGFRRADPDRPEVVFTVRYDDADGIRSAAGRRGSQAWADDALQRHGGLAFALLDASGELLPAASIAGELWAVGQVDARYSLAIANDTGSAFEVVASVDGLDVIDGRPASFAKRGYIVDPFSSVVIDGWRTSEDTVAAFRFSSVDDSYAERMGDGRNVGVIGAAFFREAPPSWERERWRPPAEDWRRDTADPFPGR